MKIKIFLLILISVICFNSMIAQKSNKKITITGIVLDSQKRPIANAIIMIDNKNTSATTNSEGVYKIKVKPGASTIGVFTFGNGTFEDSIKGRTEINFNFGMSASKPTDQPADQSVAPGEEGVNQGYGMVKKKNVTNEVNKIDGTNKKYSTYSSIYDMIQREVSGVRVTGRTIVVQGAQDLFGSVPPLFVVDGTYVDDISGIAPTSVKSIEVLKGSAASIYGSRGYGGVIVIKTKLKND